MQSLDSQTLSIVSQAASDNGNRGHLASAFKKLHAQNTRSLPFLKTQAAVLQEQLAQAQDHKGPFWREDSAGIDCLRQAADLTSAQIAKMTNNETLLKREATLGAATASSGASQSSGNAANSSSAASAPSPTPGNSAPTAVATQSPAATPSVAAQTATPPVTTGGAAPTVPSTPTGAPAAPYGWSMTNGVTNTFSGACIFDPATEVDTWASQSFPNLGAAANSKTITAANIAMTVPSGQYLYLWGNIVPGPNYRVYSVHNLANSRHPTFLQPNEVYLDVDGDNGEHEGELVNDPRQNGYSIYLTAGGDLMLKVYGTKPIKIQMNYSLIGNANQVISNQASLTLDTSSGAGSIPPYLSMQAYNKCK